MSEQKKESFVGPKKLYVYLKEQIDPLLVTFPTSINFHKAVRMVKGEVDGLMFEVWNGLQRFSIAASDVQAFIFPVEELVLRKSSKTFLYLEIMFEGGDNFRVIIAGENRLRIIYKQLEEMVGAGVKGENQWIVIPQEENKQATIRYSKPIIALTSDFMEHQSAD